MIRHFIAACLLLASTSVALAQPLEIKVGYLRRAEPRIAISLLDIPPADDGVAGARLAIEDNNTTGKFLNQRFTLEDLRLKDADDPAAAIQALAERGIDLVIADLPPDALLKAADAGRERGSFCSTPAQPMTGCARRIVAPT